MSLKVNTNTDAIGIHGKLVDTNQKISQSLQKLSSGLRLNAAKDDTAGYAVANKFKADISSLRVAYQNASEGQSLLAVADGAYNKIHDILVRMKDLATQAASSQTPQATVNNEFQLLRSEVDRIANSTKYNTTELIKSDTLMTLQVGQSSGADFHLEIGLKSATAGNLGVGAAAVSDIPGARSAMDLLDTALSSINGYMASVGAFQNRLQWSMENISTSLQNFTASESAIRDVDMAQEVTSFTKNQILQQSGMAMLAQANSAPQQILSLLKG
jgi:flagellin